MKLGHYTSFGNVIDIRQAGKTQIIVLARANFKKSAKTNYEEIHAFANQAEMVADLQSQLDARRAETGNDKAALQNVKFELRAATQADGTLQAHLEKVVSVGKAAEPAKEDVEDEAVAEA